MSGRVGDLSPKQAEILAEFRERIEDILPDLPARHDHYLLRWLRARSFNVQKAEAMLRKHLEFRKRIKADTIIEDWKPPELGKSVEMVTLIYDCEGLGLKHLWKPALEAYGEILTMFEENYPEGLKRVFLIKTPKLFPMAYNLVKHFLSEETRRKICILGSNWQEELRKYIDPEQLPVVYGGILTDPDGDPHCRTMINYGGNVPSSYYVQNNGVKVQYNHSVTISRGSALSLEYDITTPSSILRWQFASDGADIGFGVFMRTQVGGGDQKLGDMMLVLPSERYNSHMVPEDRTLTCTEPGTYVLHFDNTYSLLQSKKISYNVDVLLPDGQIQSLRSNREIGKLE
ncbi:SEC14-like protein 2 isoform X3 [Esox lucius]|uniref:SEC14-like lipid binding 7 n=1 Tax=Esox lucius TaxID=8010 RepID=A0AAY5L0I8_ESOLU|nr:SEC14-like protein 2 isoform X3 [Esox lucius]